MSTQRMCPNEACEHHGKPTALRGGCDCGTALVPFSTEPTNEQLARLVAVFSSTTPGIDPVSVEVAQEILDRLPAVRAEWLERHREVQAAVRSRS